MDIDQALRRLAADYLEALKKSLGDSLVAVVLFGSVARGEATSVSDIDLLVVASGLPKGRFARLRLLEAADESVEPGLEKLRQRGIVTELCPILKTPEEASRITPLYLDMTQDAEVLYERNHLFSKTLQPLRESLIRLGAKRLKRGKTRYWELKPDFVPGEIFRI